jgi:hypothetical protein
MTRREILEINFDLKIEIGGGFPNPPYGSRDDKKRNLGN